MTLLLFQLPHPDDSNKFSLNIWHGFRDRAGSWKNPKSLVNEFYDNDLVSSKSRARVVREGKVGSFLVYFDQRRFLLSAEMEPGCKPILTVRLLPGEEYDYALWTGAGDGGT